MADVYLVKKAKRALLGLSDRDREKVLNALDALRAEPLSGKLLKGAFDGYRSLRSWPYRIIYHVDAKLKAIYVIRIGDRKEVYRSAH